MGPVSTDVIAAGPGLAVHDWGGRGAPLLLAHATGFHGLVWGPLAERLRDQGRRVWSFDFRGHGASGRSPDGYAWARFADDVRAVLDHLGLAGDPALLAVGHSKGATALLLAEHAAPGTLHRVWAYEPVVLPQAPTAPDPTVALAVRALRRRAVWDSPEEASQAWSGRPPLDALDANSLAAYVEHGLRPRPDGTWELACAPEDEADVYAHAPAHDLWPALPSIGAVVRVVCGGATDAVGPRLAARIAERLPHGTVEVLEGLGHFGPLEAPDAAAASIARFDAATRPR